MLCVHVHVCVCVFPNNSFPLFYLSEYTLKILFLKIDSNSFLI